MDKAQIETVTDIPPGLSRVTVPGKVDCLVLISEHGVALQALPVPEPRPDQEVWTSVLPRWTDDDKKGFVIGLPAVANARAWRASFEWTAGAIVYELELLWWVRRSDLDLAGHFDGKNRDMLAYAVLRNGKLKLRTGVGVMMEQKATATEDWWPTEGTKYWVEVLVTDRGVVDLDIKDSEGYVVSIEALPPAEGELGPWPWPTLLQLGNPPEGHFFENVKVEALIPNPEVV